MQDRQGDPFRSDSLNASVDARVALVDRLFDGTGETYDSMVRWATLGVDGLWKRRLVREVPRGVHRVLDLACGTGILTQAIADARPYANVVGVELRDEYLAIARRKLERYPRVRLVLARAEDFQTDMDFDCITSSYLAKYADLPRLVARQQQLLKPGGVLLMHDFILPRSWFLRAVWRTYFALMRQTVARMVPAWREIYRGLPRLIEDTPWLHELPKLLAQHGFEDIKVQSLTLQGAAFVRARKPSRQAQRA